MPGYEIKNGDLLINFGNYADIHSHVPSPDCPMPENEILANYLMRLLAIMEAGGWRLVQRAVDEDKETAWKRYNAIDDINGQLMALQSYVSYLADTVKLIEQYLPTGFENIGVGLEDIDEQMGINSASLVSEIVILAVRLWEIKSAIDELRESPSEVDLIELIECLEEIFKISDFSVFKHLDLFSEVQSVPESILGEMEISNEQENLLEIGNDAYYLKSKVVHSGG